MGPRPPASRRPRIALFCPGIVPLLLQDTRGSVGGAELQLRLWAEQLSQRNDVVVIGRPLLPSETLREGLPFSLQALETPPDRPGPPWLRSLRYWRSVGRALRKADTDVYATRVLGIETFLVALRCRLGRRRQVFQWASDADADGRLLSAPHGAAWLVRRLAITGRRLAHVQVCQTREQLAMLRPAERRRALVFGNLLDPGQAWTPSRGDRVLWVGTIQAGPKRPDRFLDLARRMPHRRFLMVGEVRLQGGQRDAFLRQAAGLGNLEVAGFRDRAGIAGAYRQARVLVNVSDVEGFPNTFLEAAACGVPVVSLNVDPNGILQEQGAGTCLQGDLGSLPAAVDAFFGDEAWSAARRAGLAVAKSHLPGARVAAVEDRLLGRTVR